jgi:predicted PurR-regulated permease PerM
MTVNRPQRRGFAWTPLASTAALVLSLLAPALTPFLIAAVLAHALHPLVEVLASRRLRRAVVAIAELLVLPARGPIPGAMRRARGADHAGCLSLG